MVERSPVVNIDDPICAGCRSYIHRYVDPCPVCGTPHPGGFERAVAESRAAPAGASPTGSGMPRAESVSSAVTGTQELDDAASQFRRAGQLALRLEGGIPAAEAGTQVRLGLADRRLRLVDARSGRTIATIDPALVLAAVPTTKRSASGRGWSGILESSVLPAGERAKWGGNFTIVAIGDDGRATQVALSNPPGFFATKARVDYFVALASEFGDLCTVAGRVREAERGPAQYARTLGLSVAASAPVPEPSRAVPSPNAGVEYQSSGEADSLASRLAQIEEAFRAGLISAAERDSKREDVLRRF